MMQNQVHQKNGLTIIRKFELNKFKHFDNHLRQFSISELRRRCINAFSLTFPITEATN